MLTNYYNTNWRLGLLFSVPLLLCHVIYMPIFLSQASSYWMDYWKIALGTMLHLFKDTDGRMRKTQQKRQTRITTTDRLMLVSSPALDFKLPLEFGKTTFKNWEPVQKEKQQC